jgi:hypothetical protein
MCTILITSSPSPSKTDPKKNSCKLTGRGTRGSPPVATVPYSTSWTTKKPMTLKLSLRQNKPRSSTCPWICIAPTQPNTLSGRGKNHFTVGIASISSLFPNANWCQISPQSNMTLNIMRPCRLNPLLSAHEAMEGSFLFDAMPLTLLGTKVLVHLKPTQRKSWGYHAAKAWYLSHAANHYRCI